MGFTIPEHVTWKNLESGVILLDLNSSNYYTLNETASDIWRAILEGSNLDGIIAELCRKYDCSPSQCQADVNGQLTYLRQEGLLVGKNHKERKGRPR